MYTRYAGCGRTVLEHGVVTSYLDRLTLPTKRSVHLHRYALQICNNNDMKTEVIIPGNEKNLEIFLMGIIIKKERASYL